MSQEDDASTAQSPETSDEEQSTGHTTPLPRRFLATANRPVTRITDHGDETTECVRADISIETLEEFATFWSFRDLHSWKQAALESLLEGQKPDVVTYAVDEDDLEEWDVQVDGRVETFAGLAETMADYTGPENLLLETLSHIGLQAGSTASLTGVGRLTMLSRSSLTSFTRRICGDLERTSHS